jgi:hypothetical protein
MDWRMSVADFTLPQKSIPDVFELYAHLTTRPSLSANLSPGRKSSFGQQVHEPLTSCFSPITVCDCPRSTRRARFSQANT